MKNHVSGLHQHTDAQLVKLVQEKNNRAFDELMNRHSARLKIYMRLLLPANVPPEDVLQSVWMHVFMVLSSNHYCEEGMFDKWVTGIAFNTAMKAIRTEKHYVHDLQLQADEEGEEQAEGLDDTEALAYSVFMKMKSVMKRVVYLSVKKRMKCEEIAKKMNLKTNTVTKIIWRAMHRIKTEVAKANAKNSLNHVP